MRIAMRIATPPRSARTLTPTAPGHGVTTTRRDRTCDRPHRALIAAIAHAENVEDVNTLVNQGGFETHEEFWHACGEYAAR